MKSFSEYHKLNENLDDTLRDKLSEDYKSLKRGVLVLIEDSIENSTELINAQNFINDYIQENSEVVLKDFTEDADIQDFYLKYQNDVDEILEKEDNYFSKPPIEDSTYSLYDYLIKGTKEAVRLAMKEIYEEIFEI